MVSSLQVMLHSGWAWLKVGAQQKRTNLVPNIEEENQDVQTKDSLNLKGISWRHAKTLKKNSKMASPGPVAQLHKVGKGSSTMKQVIGTSEELRELKSNRTGRTRWAG